MAGDKLKILTALVQQLMTYVACRDVIEENFDNLRATRGELRAHQWAETRREKDEATFWWVLVYSIYSSKLFLILRCLELLFICKLCK